jgi:hypothetical protein
VKKVQKEAENLLLLDAGDLLFRIADYKGRSDISYELQGKRLIESYNAMGWSALGLGETEFALGLDYLRELEEMANFPFLSANILDKEEGKPLFRPYTIINLSGFRVGVTAVIGGDASFSKKREESLGIYVEDEVSALRDVTKTLKKKTDFIIVLAHTGFAEAETLAKKVDGINLIIVGHHPERSFYRPIPVNDTLLTQIYSRGKYICRLDFQIKDTGRPFNFSVTGTEKSSSLEYQQHKTRLKQLLQIYENYQAKKEEGKNVDQALELISQEIEELKRKIEEIEAEGSGKNVNVVTARMVPLDEHLIDDPDVAAIGEKYADRLIMEKNKSKEEMLNEGQRDPKDLAVSPHYVGGNSCKACHVTIHDFWLTTRHSTAYDTLRTEKRQFEPDCFSCHTTGFNKSGGFTNILTASDLLHVQCEVCHGPGSDHLIDNTVPMEKHISEGDCIVCHDEENDDDFDYVRDLEEIRCPEE